MASLDGVFNNTYGLKQSEIDEINQTFREFDLNNDGYITCKEVKECLKRTNVIAEDGIIDSVLKQMDWNHDRRVSYGEYLKFMAAIFQDEHTDLKRQLGNASVFTGSFTERTS